jgi:hypothetical protein
MGLRQKPQKLQARNHTHLPEHTLGLHQQVLQAYLLLLLVRVLVELQVVAVVVVLDTKIIIL